MRRHVGMRLWRGVGGRIRQVRTGPRFAKPPRGRCSQGVSGSPSSVWYSYAYKTGADAWLWLSWGSVGKAVAEYYSCGAVH